jgi:hypothetical protein
MPTPRQVSRKDAVARSTALDGAILEPNLQLALKDNHVLPPRGIMPIHSSSSRKFPKENLTRRLWRFLAGLGTQRRFLNMRLSIVASVHMKNAHYSPPASPALIRDNIFRSTRRKN